LIEEVEAMARKAKAKGLRDLPKKRNEVKRPKKDTLGFHHLGCSAHHIQHYNGKCGS